MDILRYTCSSRKTCCEIERSTWIGHLILLDYGCGIIQDGGDRLIIIFASQDDGNLGDGNPKGKKVSAFILGSLEEKYRKLGTSSDVYKKECEFYTEVMENACKSEYKGEVMLNRGGS